MEPTLESGLSPGLTTRVPTLADAEGIADLQNSVFIDEIGMPYTSTAEVATLLSSAAVNLETDVLLVEDRGRMVGVTTVGTMDPFERLNLDGFVRPADNGRGIGSHLMAWATQRAKQMAVERPCANPPPLLQHWASDPAPRCRALLAAHGFTLERWFHHMEIDLTAPAPDPEGLWPLPDDITIRTIELDEIGAVFEASNEAFRDHFGHEESTEENFRHFMVERNDFDPTLWFVAVTDDGTIAGVCCCVVNDTMGEVRGLVDDLAVRRPWRGEGVASQLLAVALEEMRRRNLGVGQLFVDSENPTGALGVYQRAGMFVARSFSNYSRPLM